MISVTRVLTFQQYAASNYLALRHATFKRKFWYLVCVRFGPIVGVIGVPLALWLMYYAWNAPGPHGAEFGAGCSLAFYFVYLCFYPLLSRGRCESYT